MSGKPGFRNDIQALRGWAVGIVILEHAGLEWLSSGFLGVDIFFVISGFLIAGIIARSIQDNTFSFRDFYFRRARRILPAAFVTIALTAIGAIWFLTSIEMVSLKDQTLGALTYTINFVFWNQVDYFAVDANLKPLLHMWSLAVEEQFYIFFPLLIFFTPSRWWRAVVVGLALASFAFCIWWGQSSPSGAFYMLPSRAWELGVGATAALFAGKVSGRAGSTLAVLYWPSLLLLLILPFMPYEYAHPGWIAGGICIATAVLILAQNQSVSRTWIVRAMARLGDVSYSLYLVHWPIMVFAYSAFLGETPKYLPVLTIGLSLAFAWMMYRFVEQPSVLYLRQPTKRFAAMVPLMTAFVAAVYYGSSAYAKSEVDFETLRAPNQGFGRMCDYSGRKHFQADIACTNGPDAEVLVWGDSYAMHLVDGLSQFTSLTQATFSSCMPFFDIALSRHDMPNPDLWAQRCMDFNDDVFEFLESSNSLQTVILATPWRVSLTSRNVHLIRQPDDQFAVQNGSLDFSIAALTNTVERLSAIGKRVVLVGPPPLGALDTSQCLERIATGKITFAQECSIDKSRALDADAEVRELLHLVANRYGAGVLLLSDVLCRGEVCITQYNGEPIYRDHGHLSHRGSVIVGNMMLDLEMLDFLKIDKPH